MKRHLVGICCLAAIVLGIVQSACAITETVLPFKRSWVTDPDELPFPVGIGINYYYQRQGYDMDSIKLVPDITQMIPLMPGDLGVKSRVNEVNAKVDAWLLPFLNIFAIAGTVEQATKVSNIPYPQMETLEYDDSGYIVGGGVTLAYGIKHVWASVTLADTYAGLRSADSWIQAFVLTPKIGARIPTPWPGKGLNIWVGTMFQKLEEEHTGNWDVPGLGSLHYDTKLSEKEQWNALLGLGTDLWGRVALEIEGGIGNREQFLASVAYRF